MYQDCGARCDALLAEERLHRNIRLYIEQCKREIAVLAYKKLRSKSSRVSFVR